jgi:hypothetical protein
MKHNHTIKGIEHRQISLTVEHRVTNAADFSEIRRIPGDPNLKFADFTVHKIKFF